MATHLVQQRTLSGADAVNALRPFYFAVHPDFFGQYPRERVGLLYCGSIHKLSLSACLSTKSEVTEL